MADQDSLANTKINVGLGYGDTALVAQAIVRCLEYELTQRDAIIDNLQSRLTSVEAQLANYAEVP